MRNHLIFFLLLLYPLWGLAQTSYSDEFKFKVTYKLTYQPDSTDINSARSEAMVLYLGGRVSRFSSMERSRGDSILQNRNKSSSEFRGSFGRAPQTKFDYYVYKGIPAGKISYTRKVVKNNLRYMENADLFNWKIHPETKEIAGFKSQKATTVFAGRDYTAWFTSEIPIPDGPYKFHGLPGLIVELQDQKEHYSFVVTNIQNLEQPVPFTFLTEDYMTTKKKRLEEIVEEYNKDPFAAMERRGMNFNFSSGQKKRMERERKERLDRENNPIELE